MFVVSLSRWTLFSSRVKHSSAHGTSRCYMTGKDLYVWYVGLLLLDTMTCYSPFTLACNQAQGREPNETVHGVVVPSYYSPFEEEQYPAGTLLAVFECDPMEHYLPQNSYDTTWSTHIMPNFASRLRKYHHTTSYTHKKKKKKKKHPRRQVIRGRFTAA
jgi:hypothetical protein